MYASCRCSLFLLAAMLLGVPGRGAEKNFDVEKILVFPPEKLATIELAELPPNRQGVIFHYPKKWQLQRPSFDFVAKVAQGTLKTNPPVLTLTLATPAAGLPTDVSEQNVNAYVEAIGNQLQSNPGQLEKVQPLRLGQRHFARYVLKLQHSKTKEVREHQILRTVIAGQELTLDLSVKDRAQLLAARNFAYAAAAKLDLQSDAPPAKPAEKPAVTPAPAAAAAAAPKPADNPAAKPAGSK